MQSFLHWSRSRIYLRESILWVGARVDELNRAVDRGPYNFDVGIVRGLLNTIERRATRQLESEHACNDLRQVKFREASISRVLNRCHVRRLKTNFNFCTTFQVVIECKVHLNIWSSIRGKIEKKHTTQDKIHCRNADVVLASKLTINLVLMSRRRSGLTHINMSGSSRIAKRVHPRKKCFSVESEDQWINVWFPNLLLLWGRGVLP